MQTIRESTLLELNAIDKDTKPIIEESYKAFISGDRDLGYALIQYVNSKYKHKRVRFEWDSKDRLFHVCRIRRRR